MLVYFLYDSVHLCNFFKFKFNFFYLYIFFGKEVSGDVFFSCEFTSTPNPSQASGENVTVAVVSSHFTA